MKKVIAALLVCVFLVSGVASAWALEVDYASLTDAELNELIREAMAERDSRQTIHVPVSVKASPDKYTWYVQDYVGRNAAGFGYASLGGDRLERYGAGYLQFVFVTEDGMYLDIEDDTLLQQYVVTGQNIAPNTEIRYVFQKDSEGSEYNNLVDFQSVQSIDLTVRQLDGTLRGDPVAFDLVPITPSPDKYTHYIRNYVGKNVASFGYASLIGDRRDKYGAGNIRLNLVADDGVYLDPEDIDTLKQYVVVSQDIAPNTEMKLTFLKDSKGNEYSNLVDSQTYEAVTLYVHRHNPAYPEEVPTEAPTPMPTPADGSVMRYQELYYRLTSDETVEICGYAMEQDTFIIPSEIDGRQVVGIADRAFENCAMLQTMLNWADWTYIGASAFRGCTGLQSIRIPWETTFLGESAFEGCTSLETVYMWGNPVQIERNTFKDCAKLTSISLPISVQFIAESAFENCFDLSTVYMWGGITSIGKKAFKNCSSLEDISIPNCCEVIEEAAFQHCTALETVLFWGGTSMEKDAFQGCTSLKTISIPSDTAYIGEHAFDGCTSLETVTMWGSTIRIGKDAFANCPNLEDVPR